MKKENYKIHLPEDWEKAITKISSPPSLDKPIQFVEKEISENKIICPPYNQIFNAFKYCSFLDLKVVIFGQDPYFQKNVANGLAFSVKKNQAMPMSLKNIYKEIENDVGKTQNSDGCLKNWAKQGVLLLNSSLTVEVGKPGSHSNIGWHEFIIKILKTLKQKKNIVFILWGNHAIKFSKYIDQGNNLILKSSHPSPLSAHKGFFGSNHFSKCNSYLRKNDLKEIFW